MKQKAKVRSKPSPIERFLALSDAQKDAEVAPFDKGEVPLSQSRPLTPAERKQWSQIRRGLGRPKIGRGSVIVPISIERGLLEEVNEFAASHHLKRSQMMAQGLRLLMRKMAS
ncbi:MAG: hypothetical protein ABSB42_16710 [Tepidisphaeraceae bacterium]|jgi:hypothetical protein